MKKYIKPKIKAIKLDAEQAILNVCAVSGVYFNTPTTRCFPQGSDMAAWWLACLRSGKPGIIETSAELPPITDAMPS